MSVLRGTGGIQRLTAALSAFLFAWMCMPVHAADPVEQARAARHAAEAAKEGIGIPALSEGQMNAYLDGRAMWMASVAELNRYPGPRQVLELAEKLELTAKQQQAIVELHEETHPELVRLGKQLIAQEQRLNRIFVWGQASAENTQNIVADIGVLQARLRFTHLLAHIRTRDLLTAGQVKRYDELQGYAVTSVGSDSSKMGCNAAHHHGR